MKASVSRPAFVAAFQACAAVAPSRSPKPVLRNVKLEARESGGVLLGTDLEVAMRVELPSLVVETAGDAILPVSHFGTILRECPDDELRLESDGHELLVQGERSEFRLQAISADEFPPVPSFEASSYYRFPARLMQEMIRRTVFATDNESTRYALGGVLWEFSEQRVIAVGTDGRRMAKMEGPCEAIGEPGDAGESGTIVPTRAMQIIERALANVLSDEPEAEVHMETAPQRVVVRMSGVTVSSNLVEGRFPRWRDVLPEARQAHSIELSVGPFYSAVRQAQIATSEESRGVDFQFSEGLLVLRAQSANVGQTRIQLPIAYDGKDLEVTLDPRFVGDFLKVLDPGSTFALEMMNSDAAVVCRTDDGYAYVLMPLARERKRNEAAVATA